MRTPRRLVFAIAITLLTLQVYASFRSQNYVTPLIADHSANSLPTNADWMTSRLGPHIDYGLKDFDFTDRMHGYAVASGHAQFPVVYRSLDGGESWTKKSIRSDRNPLTIRFRNVNEGILTIHDTTGCPKACQHRTVVLTTVDSGDSWERFEYKQLRGIIPILEFDKNGNAFALLYQAVLEYGESHTRTSLKLMKSSNLGQTWSILYEPLGWDSRVDHPDSVANPKMILSDDHIYLLGQRGGRILRLDHDGREVDTIHTGYQSVNGLHVASDDTYYITAFVDGGMALARTNNTGETWTRIYASKRLGFVAVRSENDAVAIAHHGSRSTPDGVIARTVDGGNRWIEDKWQHGLFMNTFSRFQQVDVDHYMILVRTRLLTFTFDDAPAGQKLY